MIEAAFGGNKEATIKREKSKLRGIFKDLPPDARKTVEKLIDNAAFMAATLEELQAYINIHGCTEEYQNGENQYGKKKSSEVDVYNTMIKNYKAVIDTLLGRLPKAAPGGDDDGFDDFAEGREE
jgi:hypothetical protein